jgi:hypothetical protein
VGIAQPITAAGRTYGWWVALCGLFVTALGLLVFRRR